LGEAVAPQDRRAPGAALRPTANTSTVASPHGLPHPEGIQPKDLRDMLTRRLTLAALAASLAAPALAQKKNESRGASVAGRYRAEGRNPDGSAYAGTVEIAQEGDSVAVAWQVGNDNYSGTGTIDGRVITVDWGDATPVVYVVMPDGALHGTWADGTALERLLPQ
jgi:hypothetical protein